jgi:predicted phosphodiesterase
MSKYFLICLSIILGGCQYELSPWSTDADCSDNVSVDYNIARLKALEEEQGSQTSYKVALLSDPQMYPGAFLDVIKRINNMDEVAFVLLSGDLAETGIKSEFEWTCKAMSQSTKPIFAVVGNHDALSFGKEIWLKAFGDFDYSFTYQNSKFVAYNDNKYEFDNVPDRDWLAEEADVAIGEVRLNTIAVSHIAPWENDLELSQHLLDSGFDLTLHGHEHGFDFWQLLDVMLPHYITSLTKLDEYGILTVSGTDLSLENCKGGVCTPAYARTVTD